MTLDQPKICYACAPLYWNAKLAWAASESWTRDLILTKDALYHWAKAAKSGKRDSNPRPPAWKASALSTELFPRDFSYRKNLAQVLASSSCEYEYSLALLKTSAKYLRVLWVRMDSNHRSRKTADLQSAPFGHSGTHPWFKEHLLSL